MSLFDFKSKVKLVYPEHSMKRMFSWIFILLFLVLLDPSSSSATSLLGSKGRDYFRVTTHLVKVDGAELGFNDTLTDTVAKAIGAEITSNYGVGYSGALGFEFNFGLRTELEYSYRNVDLNKITSTVGSIDIAGNYTLNTLMGNIGYRHLSSHKLSPYLGGGIGMAWHDAEVGAGISGSDSTIAYQLLVGLDYLIGPRSEIGIGYSYLGTPDPDFGGITAEIGVHNIGISVRQYFGHRPKKEITKKRPRKRAPRDKWFDRMKLPEKHKKDNRPYQGSAH